MKYYVLNHEGPEDAVVIPKADNRWDRWTAQEAAEHYHDEHDGWESTWPLTFVILDDEGTEKHRYIVDREFTPVFYAMAIS